MTDTPPQEDRPDRRLRDGLRIAVAEPAKVAGEQLRAELAELDPPLVTEVRLDAGPTPPELVFLDLGRQHRAMVEAALGRHRPRRDFVPPIPPELDTPAARTGRARRDARRATIAQALAKPNPSPGELRTALVELARQAGLLDDEG